MTTRISTVTKERHNDYWRRVRRLTLILLAVWFIVTMSVIFFARELSALTLFGWPFSFYMAAQGSTLIYVVITGLYAWRMQRLDARRAGRNADAD